MRNPIILAQDLSEIIRLRQECPEQQQRLQLPINDALSLFGAFWAPLPVLAIFFEQLPPNNRPSGLHFQLWKDLSAFLGLLVGAEAEVPARQNGKLLRYQQD